MSKQGLQMLSVLVVYLAGLAAVITAIVTEQWVTTDDGRNWGVLRFCLTTGDCDWFTDNHTTSEFVALGILAGATVCAILAGLSFTIVPISAALQVSAGLLQILGAFIYVPHFTKTDHYGWSFYVALGGGGLLLLCGFTHGVLANINKYPLLRAVLPCCKKYPK